MPVRQQYSESRWRTIIAHARAINAHFPGLHRATASPGSSMRLISPRINTYDAAPINATAPMNMSPPVERSGQRHNCADYDRRDDPGDVGREIEDAASQTHQPRGRDVGNDRPAEPAHTARAVFAAAAKRHAAHEGDLRARRAIGQTDRQFHRRRRLTGHAARYGLIECVRPVAQRQNVPLRESAPFRYWWFVCSGFRFTSGRA